MKFVNWLSSKRLYAYNPAGDMIPAWAGIVQRDYSRDGFFYAPLGFNWLIRWGMGIWRWAQAGYYTETPFELGYITGRSAARVDDRYMEGYTKGHEAGRKESQKAAWVNGYEFAYAERSAFAQVEEALGIIELQPMIEAVTA